MLLTYEEAYKKYKNDYGILNEIRSGNLYKITKGIYSDKKNIDLAVVYCAKYSKAVLTMDSAFYYYKLTDVIPQRVYLAVPYNSHLKKEKDIIFKYTDEKVINVGKVSMNIDGEKVNVYDKERLLIELIRKRKQIPFDYYKEIILNYRKISDELDMNKIEKYLSFFKNEYNIFEALMREVF